MSRKVDRGAIEAKRHGIKRSPKWPKVRKAFLKANPVCAACGIEARQGGLQAHHVIPFYYAVLLNRPDLELDPRNLITLCEDEEGKTTDDHHLLVGHLDNFQSSNPAVKEDAEKTYHGMTAEKIRKNGVWLAGERNRMKPWNAMTTTEKYALRKLMDKLFPLVEKAG